MEAHQRVDYAQLFSKEARELKASALAALVNAFNGMPDVVTLHAGLPSAETFPLTSLTATTGAVSSSQDSVQVDVTGQLMGDAQQYMFHSGHPPLLRWTRQFAADYHHPPNPVDCAITSGAVNALACAAACLCDQGDYVLCEEYAYTHAGECVFIPRGLKMLPVAMDGEGMIPDSLREVLQNTPPSPVTGKPPRVLYIIPSGQNPTAAVMPLARKREIYQICREHGIIILEDDAYYWLQYPQGSSIPESSQPGLQLPASFLSLDVDSRVLRIDTVSKLLGPGYRLGWVTGAQELVAKLAQAVQAGSCGPCSLSQVVVSQLLDKWGMHGFEGFLRRQQALYARRADLAAQAAARHLTGLATWQEPRAGMFMWFKLTGLPDVDDGLVQQLVQQRVVIIPGRPFWTALDKSRGGAPCPYFRVTFGSVPEDRIDAGFERLAAAIRAAMSLHNAAATSLPAPLPDEKRRAGDEEPTTDKLHNVAVSVKASSSRSCTRSSSRGSSLVTELSDSITVAADEVVQSEIEAIEGMPVTPRGSVIADAVIRVTAGTDVKQPTGLTTFSSSGSLQTLAASLSVASTQAGSTPQA